MTLAIFVIPNRVSGEEAFDKLRAGSAVSPPGNMRRRFMADVLAKLQSRSLGRIPYLRYPLPK
jgi:hypothetical protein